MDELISVIVPVYNVEKYLHQCIDSILMQTYKNLEIILVDDGSTDQSGSICDEYARQDKRVVTIHQKNKGLAGARNTGLDIMSGEWISFVDSDDWISNLFYEKQLLALKQHGAELALVRFSSSEDDFKKLHSNTIAELVLDSNQLLETYYKTQNSKKITTSVWPRLYRANLIHNMRFPEGFLNEDILFTVETFLKCNLAVYIDEPLYYYRKIRIGSIMNAKFSSKRVMDNLELYTKVESLLISKGKAELTVKNFYNLYNILSRALYTADSKDTVELIKKYRKDSNNKVGKALQDATLTSYEKIVLLMNLLCPRIKVILEDRLINK